MLGALPHATAAPTSLYVVESSRLIKYTVATGAGCGHVTCTRREADGKRGGH
jgi:hypothetical protein